jgi:tetratricopeptide (TPR) repeat protein
MADMQYAAHHLGEAESWIRRELDLATRVQGEKHAATLTAKARLGNLLQELGRADEAETMHGTVRRELQAERRDIDPYMVSYMRGILGLRLLDRGRPDLLLPILRADLDELKRTIPHSVLVASRQRLWAQTLAALGRHEAARQALAEAQAVWTRFAGEKPSRPIDAAFALAWAEIELAAQRPDAALAALDRHPAVGRRAEMGYPLLRARALLALGRAPDAADAVAAARRAQGAVPEAERPRPLQADALLLDGRVRLALGNAASAEALLRQALDLRLQHDAEGSLWVAELRNALAGSLERQGRRAAAQALRLEAMQARAAVITAGALAASAVESR